MGADKKLCIILFSRFLCDNKDSLVTLTDFCQRNNRYLQKTALKQAVQNKGTEIAQGTEISSKTEKTTSDKPFQKETDSSQVQLTNRKQHKERRREQPEKTGLLQKVRQ